MGFEGIGASVRRKEDFRFLSGRGSYKIWGIIEAGRRKHAPGHATPGTAAE
jgi:hypothetical protein